MLNAHHNYILNRDNRLLIETPPLSVLGGAEDFEISHVRYNINNVNNFVINSDFILINDEEIQFPGFAQEVYTRFKESFEKNKNLFNLVETFDLPKGTTFYLYKKKDLKN